MAKDFGWSPSVSGIIQSAFFYGYMLTQIPGGWVTARLGGRRVLPFGVSIWSFATAGVPLLAGTLPGVLSHQRTAKMPFRLSRAAHGQVVGAHVLLLMAVCSQGCSRVWSGAPQDTELMIRTAGSSGTAGQAQISLPCLLAYQYSSRQLRQKMIGQAWLQLLGWQSGVCYHNAASPQSLVELCTAVSAVSGRAGTEFRGPVHRAVLLPGAGGPG